MATDRPDQTEASGTVGQGVLQIETGVVFSKHVVEFYNGETERTRDYATTLLRYGLFDNIELRIASAYTEHETETPSQTISGMQPLSIGTKIEIHAEQGWRPEVAFIGHLTLPVGDDDFKPEYVAPDFRFSLAHTLSERFSLGYNVGMEWDGSDPKGSFIYTIALGASIAGPVSAFAELFGESHHGWNHFADFGITVLATPNLQFDASYGLPIQGQDTRFLNAGVSFRI
jgi:hypothetical protein